MVNDSASSLASQAVISRPVVIPRSDDSIYLDYFAVFIERCHFSAGFATLPSDLLPLLDASGSLKDLVLAIGALETSRRGSSHNYPRLSSPHEMSLRFYGRSIKAFQEQIRSSEGIEKVDVLWTTLLFGIFEVGPFL